MDIFTTQLTRIVPVPIQPEKLRVKALIKEAAMGKLKGDEKELVEADYFSYKPYSNKEGNSSEKEANQGTTYSTEEAVTDETELDEEDNQETKHLDVFV